MLIPNLFERIRRYPFKFSLWGQHYPVSKIWQGHNKGLEANNANERHREMLLTPRQETNQRNYFIQTQNSETMCLLVICRNRGESNTAASVFCALWALAAPEIMHSYKTLCSWWRRRESKMRFWWTPLIHLWGDINRPDFVSFVTM